MLQSRYSHRAMGLETIMMVHPSTKCSVSTVVRRQSNSLPETPGHSHQLSCSLPKCTPPSTSYHLRSITVVCLHLACTLPAPRRSFLQPSLCLFSNSVGSSAQGWSQHRTQRSFVGSCAAQVCRTEILFLAAILVFDFTDMVLQ